MSRIKCLVCNLIYTDKMIKELEKELDKNIVQGMEQRVCSTKCEKILDESWENKVLKCFHCGKTVNEREWHSWNCDYEKKVVSIVCEPCRIVHLK